jgi:hypothetical protein
VKQSKPCPNCQSQKHLKCCARCGAAISPKRRAYAFCTVKCQNLQAAADKLSAQMEENDLANVKENADG